MRHGVHAARRRNARGKVQRQFRIVDGGRGQRRGAFAGDAILGDADEPARRHFRAGISRDDCDVRNFGGCRGGFGEPNRRAAADHDETVGIETLQLGQHALERIAWHVLPGGVAKADAAVGERRGDAAREIGARFRAQHHEPRHVVEFGLGTQRADRACAEDDAHGIGVVGEAIHVHHFSLISRTSLALAVHAASKKPRSVPVET